MKILHVINSLDIGGAESLLAALLANWSDEHHVVVLQGQGPLSEKVGRSAASLTSVGASKSSRDLVKMLVGVQRQVDRLRPDILHSHLVQSDFVSLLINARGAKRITSVHVASIQETDPLRSRIMAHAVGRLSRFFAVAIATSDRSVEYMKSLRYSSPAIVINNGTPVVEQPLFDPNRVVFLSLARFNPVKGHDVLLKAFKQHLESYPESRLLCAGEGVSLENSRFASLAADAGFSQSDSASARFLGPCLNVAELFAHASALVISSFSETFPMVGSEACMHGVPVITTDVGGASSFALRSDMLVSPKSVGALARAMNCYAEMQPHERAKLSQESRCKALKQFDIGISARAYTEVYNGLVSTSSRSESKS
ncbi:glycosyltransferase [Arthrobacter sp. Z4-13]